MTGDEILDALEHIDPDLIEAADALLVRCRCSSTHTGHCHW